MASDPDDAVLPGRSLHRWLVHLLGMDLERRHQIYAGVASSANLLDGAYWLEILFSAGIATLGLILNSPAVIIGAMLISPLMGPILANGLALAAGDLVLSLRALASVFLSALVAVSFATLLVVLLPFREMTAEIAARTQPNTLDLVIALFSGAVGSIAVCKNVRGVATSIPGVAIAVALMPPLCVVGYGVGLVLTTDRVQGKAVVHGGGLLFLTNLVAITFTAMIVFLILHVDGSEVRKRIRESREAREDRGAGGLIEGLPIPKALAKIGSLPGRFILIVLFIALLVVPLSRSLDSLKQEITQRQSENRLQKRATQLWQDSFAHAPSGEERSYIDTLSASERDGRVGLHLRVFTSKPYSHDERADFIHRLSRLLGRRPEAIDLSLVEIPTSRYEVATREKQKMEQAPPPATASVIAELRNRIEEGVAVVKLPAPAALDAHVLTLTAAGEQLEITYVSVREIDPDGQALLGDRYRQAVDDADLRIVLRRVANVALVPFGRRETSLSDPAAAAMNGVQELAVRHPSWPVTLEAPAGDPAREPKLASIREHLATAGIAATRMSVRDGTTGGYRVTVSPVSVTAESQ